MLKDLEQRDANEERTSQALPLPIPVRKGANKVVLASLTALILLSVLSLFAWQLYSENKQLKKSNVNSQAIKTVVNEQELARPINNTQQKLIEGQLLNQNKAESSQVVANNIMQAEVLISKASLVIHNRDPLPPVNSNIHKLKSVTKENIASVKLVMPEVIVNESASMEVSRRQLSPEDLAQQKMIQAKKAIELNKLELAEHLFEDILLLQVNNKNARKQLAALWFGRKAYQDALNILSQGIALDSNDSEYRLMKARIYLSQGKNQQALLSLLALADVKDIEYQLILVKTAQQLQQHNVTIKAYKNLLTMQANNGRWWLGLAVAYDQSSEFEHAKQAYVAALSQQDLSASAIKFSKQRLQALEQ